MVNSLYLNYVMINILTHKPEQILKQKTNVIKCKILFLYSLKKRIEAIGPFCVVMETGS